MDLVNFWTTYIKARFGKSEKGAALVEYALLLALIAVVCIIALQFLGSNAADKFSTVGNSIADA
jgi:pilus assembly protein Flp/PilA